MDLHAGPRLKGSKVALVGAPGMLALLLAIAGTAFGASAPITLVDALGIAERNNASLQAVIAKRSLPTC